LIAQEIYIKRKFHIDYYKTKGLSSTYTKLNHGCTSDVSVIDKKGVKISYPKVVPLNALE